jgi:membrane protein YdbS with pleckstrin-like domain
MRPIMASPLPPTSATGAPGSPPPSTVPPYGGVDVNKLVPQPRLIRASLLSQGEQLLRETRATLWYFLPGPIIFTAIFLILLGAAAPGWLTIYPITPLITVLNKVGSKLPQYIELLFAFLALLGVLWIVVRYFQWIRTVYAVTTSRVVIQRGILSRDFDEIPVNKVRAVEIHQGILQRLLGYGTVRVTSEGENRIANEAWRGIPKPWEFQRLINGAAEKYGR